MKTTIYLIVDSLILNFYSCAFKNFINFAKFVRKFVLSESKISFKKNPPNPLHPSAKMMSAVNPIPIVGSCPSCSGSSVHPPSLLCLSMIHFDAAVRLYVEALSSCRSCNACMAKAVLLSDPKLPRGPCSPANPSAGRRIKCCKCRWR